MPLFYWSAKINIFLVLLKTEDHQSGSPPWRGQGWVRMGWKAEDDRTYRLLTEKSGTYFEFSKLRTLKTLKTIL